MVSLNSALYKAHPDWCLHVPSRGRTTGRNQLVLDFTRKEVRDNIFGQLSDLLSSGNIAYVKWDCNRCVSSAWMGSWRSGVCHCVYCADPLRILTRFAPPCRFVVPIVL